jgi:DNA-binding transcriptional LysR family regulator
MSVELRNLKILLAVSRAGGFSSAAQQLGVTQSAVSKSIRQLEQECGAELVERLPRGVKLTAAGEVVCRRAANLAAEEEHLFSELAELKGLLRGRLRLGVPPFGSSVIFAPLVGEFHRRYPGVQLELNESGAKELEEELRRGGIEMAASLIPVPDDFEWKELMKEPLMALVPEGHPLAGRASLKLGEISPYPLILFESGFALNVLITGAFRKRRLELREAARSAHPDFIVALVAAGLGIAILPRLVIDSMVAAGVRSILVDEPDFAWHIAAIWRKEASLSPAALKWLELVHESSR